MSYSEGVEKEPGMRMKVVFDGLGVAIVMQVCGEVACRLWVNAGITEDECCFIAPVFLFTEALVF